MLPYGKPKKEKSRINDYPINTELLAFVVGNQRAVRVSQSRANGKCLVSSIKAGKPLPALFSRRSEYHDSHRHQGEHEGRDGT